MFILKTTIILMLVDIIFIQIGRKKGGQSYIFDQHPFFLHAGRMQIHVSNSTSYSVGVA